MSDVYGQKVEEHGEHGTDSGYYPKSLIGSRIGELDAPDGLAKRGHSVPDENKRAEARQKSDDHIVEHDFLPAYFIGTEDTKRTAALHLFYIPPEGGRQRTFHQPFKIMKRIYAKKSQKGVVTYVQHTYLLGC
jgi:hypothetical protein